MLLPYFHFLQPEVTGEVGIRTLNVPFISMIRVEISITLSSIHTSPVSSTHFPVTLKTFTFVFTSSSATVEHINTVTTLVGSKGEMLGDFKMTYLLVSWYIYEIKPLLIKPQLPR